jgi:hypothetical protein
VKVDDPLSNPHLVEFPGATVSQGATNQFTYDLSPLPAWA